MPYYCGACDENLGDDGESPPIKPCPKRGEDGVVIWNAPGTPRVLASIRGGQRPPGGGKWISKMIHEDSLFQLTGKMHRVIRLISRITNEYYERIIDKETGETVREVREPLTEHRGRGSAKKKRDETTKD
jgi:hypothetical protein